MADIEHAQRCRRPRGDTEGGAVAVEDRYCVVRLGEAFDRKGAGFAPVEGQWGGRDGGALFGFEDGLLLFFKFLERNRAVW